MTQQSKNGGTSKFTSANDITQQHSLQPSKAQPTAQISKTIDQQLSSQSAQSIRYMQTQIPSSQARSEATEASPLEATFAKEQASSIATTPSVVYAWASRNTPSFVFGIRHNGVPITIKFVNGVYATEDAELGEKLAKAFLSRPDLLQAVYRLPNAYAGQFVQSAYQELDKQKLRHTRGTTTSNDTTVQQQAQATLTKIIEGK